MTRCFLSPSLSLSLMNTCCKFCCKLLQFEFYVMFIYGDHCKKVYNKNLSFIVNVIFRTCYLMLSLPLLVAVAPNETPQQVVTRYNNYKAICNGLGYKNLGCKGSEVHFPFDIWNLLIKHIHCSLSSCYL